MTSVPAAISAAPIRLFMLNCSCRHHLAGLSQLQCPVVAQPRRARGQAGQDQKQPAFPADLGNAALRVGQEHHAPGHDHHHQCANGRRQIGIDPVDADFRQDRGQRGKYRGKHRIHSPHEFPSPLTFQNLPHSIVLPDPKNKREIGLCVARAPCQTPVFVL